jgi:hypothetical protein
MENFEQIERFLLGRMTEEERRAFEIQLSTDENLRKEKEDLEVLIIGIESKGFKDKLKGRKIGEPSSIKDEKSPRTIFLTLRKLSIAASLVGIIVASWYFLQPTTDPYQELYASSFSPDPGLPTPMSETDNYTFYDAMVDYKMEKFDLAISKWSQMEGSIGSDTLNYYLGMAHLNVENLTEAESILKTIPESSSFSDMAKWYLVRIYLDQKELQKAKEVFNSLPNDVHPKYNVVKDFFDNN